GSGKTTTLMTFVDYALENNQACILIDGKGDPELTERVETLAEKYGRVFYEFNTDGTGMRYNPLSEGTPSELTDKMMTLSDWSEEHYKLSSQEFLQYLFRVFKEKNISANLTTVSKYCNKESLIALITENQKKQAIHTLTEAEIPKEEKKEPGILFFNSDSEEIEEASEEVAASVGVEEPEKDKLREIIGKIERIDDKAIKGLASRLSILAEGDLRDLFKEDGTNTLELNSVIEEKAIVVFSLDSLRYPDVARQLGKLIINDIKTNVSRHSRTRKGERVTLIFDEFNVFVSEQVVDVINKSRSAGFEALLSFQSLADIDAVSVPLRRQIIQNSNTLIVQRQNEATDAEELAKTLGTKDGYAHTFQTGEDGMTGQGSVRGIKEFWFHPDEIKELGQGMAIVKRQSSKGTIRKKVKIRKVD
ncbi:type IV secretory system conjugative DNA transfer family protein, partial [Bacillus badius]|uniref:type IV secretory system conjugative DNA transfer family protein n=1 Tax=Bacillus badius TaxID=1455 RepID=UPI002E210171|nr:TraM recognition domain-containing protein [Bacillus badius]